MAPDAAGEEPEAGFRAADGGDAGGGGCAGWRCAAGCGGGTTAEEAAEATRAGGAGTLGAGARAADAAPGSGSGGAARIAWTAASAAGETLSDEGSVSSAQSDGASPIFPLSRRPLPDRLDDPPVLQIHHLAQRLLVHAVARDEVAVRALLREEDLAPHVHERLDDRVRDAAVLRLHVVHALGVLHVGVEPGDHVDCKF